MATYSPENIKPLHDARDYNKLQALINNMAQNGWVGRPILVLDVGNDLQAITGSHRIQAAIDVELDEIPVYIIDASDHIIGDDGNCEVCGENCWIAELYDANDDYDRLSALELSGDKEAIEIMEAELNN